MIEASLDRPANLLRVSYSGTVGAEEMSRWVAKIQSMVNETQPGFRLLSDLSRLESMGLACVPYIEQVMDFCDDRNVAMVVRIIPDRRKDIGLNIMSLFHYRRGVRIVTCETLAEAVAILAR